MIAIIDYGVGNLFNVIKAFEFLGMKTIVTKDPLEVVSASHVILPGVGAFDDAAFSLRKTGMDKAVYAAAAAGIPLLGICLGMQLLFESSAEGGKEKGLSLLPGRLERFDNELKVPHMGWNRLQLKKKCLLFNDLPENPYAYFVHSYYLPVDKEVTVATADYGLPISAVVQKDNIYGTQFHPEKSSSAGLKMLENFASLGGLYAN